MQFICCMRGRGGGYRQPFSGRSRRALRGRGGGYRQPPSSRSRRTLRGRGDLDHGGLRRAPAFITQPRVLSQGSANDSDTPGTRALWSKLREIAQLQESDPSVALACAGTPTLTAAP